MYEVTTRTPALVQQLVTVWEASVRATHLFLSDAEIMQIKAYVPQGPARHEVRLEMGKKLTER